MVSNLHQLFIMNRVPNYTRSQLNHFSSKILNAAFKVHSKLGPGLLEKAYEVCLKHEINLMGLRVCSQQGLPINYDGQKIDLGYRVDLIVEKSIVIELKSVEQFSPLHEAQLLTYLRLSGCSLGLLINFNVVRLADGIKRLVRDF